MARKLGWLDMMFGGDYSEHAAINSNAENLEVVEADLGKLQTIVHKQAQEIMQLRAMVLGLVEVIQERVPFTDGDLEGAMKRAWLELNPPPPEPKAAEHPYRGAAQIEPTPDEIAAAKALLNTAQDHHFSKRFDDARAIYQQIVEQHGNTKQAATARAQLDNLRKA